MATGKRPTSPVDLEDIFDEFDTARLLELAYYLAEDGAYERMRWAALAQPELFDAVMEEYERRRLSRTN